MTGGQRRHQVIADKKLQGTLLAHTIIYWFYCLFSVTLIAVCWIIFTKQPETSSELLTQLWLNCGPALLGSVLLLPLVLLDCMRLSSRFAGPMVRMQRVMQQLAAGETPPAITLRPGDYWTEFADDVNLVMERLRQQDSQTPTPCPPAPAISDVTASESPAEEAQPDAGSPFVPPITVRLAEPIYVPLAEPIDEPIDVPLAEPIDEPLDAPITMPLAASADAPSAEPITMPLVVPLEGPVTAQHIYSDLPV